jgi:hypothetical protein
LLLGIGELDVAEFAEFREEADGTLDAPVENPDLLT